MKVLRSVFSVIIGYFLFALSAFAFFRLSGQPPHEEAPLPFVIGSTVFGMVFAFFGGYLAAWLAKRRPLAHAISVAIVLAVGAIASLFSTLGHGAIWSQLAALILMAPSAVIGGWLRSRQNARGT